MEQHVQYCTTQDGVRIAYAITGSGPPLVWVPGWLSHLELEWAFRRSRERAELIARRMAYIRHDKRGNGLSSRQVGDYSIETSVLDLESLVDHLSLERFAIGGRGEGAVIAMLYAAHHPERVSKLLAYGSYARGDGLMAPPEVREAVRLLVKSRWGVASKLLSAMLVGEEAYLSSAQFASYQLASVSADEAPLVLDRAFNVDIRHVLGDITAPTLVLHHRDDIAVPIELGQEVAAGIKGAIFLSEAGGHYPSAQGVIDVARAALSFLLDERIENLAAASEDVPRSGGDTALKIPASQPAFFSDARLTIDTEQHVVALNGEPVDLSPIEFKLLVAMAKVPGRVHAYNELLATVWGSEYIGETDFLHVYISRLRKKLGQGVIATERGFGYRFAPA